MIDLRSDTVTKPSPAMRQAIANAEVGDDVLGEDPTMNRLEARTAEILGTEAAVYMPSGTMTNQVAVRAHTEPGDEILLDRDTHIYFYEAGAPAALSGVMVRLIPGRRGIFSAQDLEAAIRPDNIHFPRPKLLIIENTHNRGSGAVWPMETIIEVTETARKHGLRIHLDGARIWNASAATGIPEAEIARHFDTVSVCFSKGLGAPVGSALAGTREFIARARRFRKQFGGGMRQAGLMAAGALYALENNRARLIEDHANARRFAEGIHGLPGIEVDPAGVETNIVVFRVTSLPAADLSRKLRVAGLLMNATGPDTVRAVTHLDVSRADIDRAVEIMEKTMK
ncbi:MAG: low-specificity L-threonine aldolase [Candidatus Latescibacterota bacterium]